MTYLTSQQEKESLSHLQRHTPVTFVASETTGIGVNNSKIAFEKSATSFDMIINKDVACLRKKNMFYVCIGTKWCFEEKKEKKNNQKYHYY